jgi:ribonuclease T2
VNDPALHASVTALIQGDTAAVDSDPAVPLVVSLPAQAMMGILGNGGNMTKIKVCMVVCLVLLASGGAETTSHHGHPTSRGSAQPGVFDYYLVSLSWSPTYCVSHPDDRAQCARKGYGFVLHGLWPQYTRGGYPQTCRTRQTLTPAARQFANSVFPSPKLVDHEWAKHGTCSGLDAMGYFQLADQAHASIHIPDALSAPKRPLSLRTAQITEAFTAANPQLASHSLAVICSGQDLAEVRVCLDKDLAPTACGKGVAAQCRSGAVRVRPIR